jgi:plastocyanin
MVGMLVAAAASQASAATLTVHVTDTTGANLSDAVIYAIPAVLPNKPPAPAEVAQVARTFTPLVTVVQTGGAVSFPNRDTVKHQVYSFSPAKVFQLKLYAGLPAAPIVFDKAGLVVLGCNIHDAMVAYVVVVDTPYFAKTTTTGVATLEGLPAGEYKVSVWHPRIGTQAPPRPLVLPGEAKLDAVVELANP